VRVVEASDRQSLQQVGNCRQVGYWPAVGRVLRFLEPRRSSSFDLLWTTRWRVARWWRQTPRRVRDFNNEVEWRRLVR